MQQLIQKDNFFGNTQDYSRVSGDLFDHLWGWLQVISLLVATSFALILLQSMIGAMSKHALLRRTLTWILEHPALINWVIAVAAYFIAA